MNSFALALYDYKDRDDLGQWNQNLSLMGKVFTIVFAVEAILETIARGFFMHPGAYLRDGWCLMDFVVLVSG
jgi:hypothetical protein